MRSNRGFPLIEQTLSKILLSWQDPSFADLHEFWDASSCRSDQLKRALFTLHMKEAYHDRSARDTDDALVTLADLFPDRQVVGIHSVDLILGLGALHCLTQQEPKVLPST